MNPVLSVMCKTQNESRLDPSLLAYCEFRSRLALWVRKERFDSLSVFPRLVVCSDLTWQMCVIEALQRSSERGHLPYRLGRSCLVEKSQI